MEIASLIIAAMSLILCAYTYFKHDKKLKAQQALINEYEISRIQNEVVEQKKADVRAYITNLSYGRISSATLVIRNNGKADARNIYVCSETYCSRTNLPHVQGIELGSQCQVEYPFEWPFGYGGGEIRAIVSWNDGSGMRQSNKCMLHL